MGGRPDAENRIPRAGRAIGIGNTRIEQRTEPTAVLSQSSRRTEQYARPQPSQHWRTGGKSLPGIRFLPLFCLCRGVAEHREQTWFAAGDPDAVR